MLAEQRWMLAEQRSMRRQQRSMLPEHPSTRTRQRSLRKSCQDPIHDGSAKPYQVKQARQVITRYRPAGENDAE